MDRRKILLVGFGKRGQSVWLPVITSIFRSPFVDILDTNFHGKNIPDIKYVSYKNSISKKDREENYDLTIICVPPEFHLSVLKDTIHFSSKIILETPFGKTAAQKNAIHDLKTKYPEKIHLFDNFLYSPSHLYIKHLESVFGPCLLHGKVNDFMGSHSRNQFGDIFNNSLLENISKLTLSSGEVLQSNIYRDENSNSLIGFEYSGDFNTNINRPSRPGLQFTFFEKATLVTLPFRNITWFQRVKRKLRLRFKLHVGYIYHGRNIENVYLDVKNEWFKIGSRQHVLRNPSSKYMELNLSDAKKSKYWIYSSIVIGLQRCGAIES